MNIKAQTSSRPLGTAALSPMQENLDSVNIHLNQFTIILDLKYFCLRKSHPTKSKDILWDLKFYKTRFRFHEV
jgi:hypothetical protein